MKNLKALFRSPHIQIALATGFSIIVIAYFSKRVLAQPIGYLPAATPPFLMVVFEAVYTKNNKSRYAVPAYWIAAIFVTTAAVIILSALNYI